MWVFISVTNACSLIFAPLNLLKNGGYNSWLAVG
jgi:hypothetical protein